MWAPPFRTLSLSIRSLALPWLLSAVESKSSRKIHSASPRLGIAKAASWVSSFASTISKTSVQIRNQRCILIPFHCPRRRALGADAQSFRFLSDEQNMTARSGSCNVPASGCEVLGKRWSEECSCMITVVVVLRLLVYLFPSAIALPLLEVLRQERSWAWGLAPSL